VHDVGTAHAFSVLTRKFVRDGEFEEHTEQRSIDAPSLADVLCVPWRAVLEQFQKRFAATAHLWLAFRTVAAWTHRDDAHRDESVEDTRARLVAQHGVSDTDVPRALVAQLAAASAPLRAEFAPVCSVMGGLLAQEVLKTISHREAPIDNVILFDAVARCGAIIRRIAPAAPAPAGAVVEPTKGGVPAVAMEIDLDD
jgi:ubiquitin-like 1-activating enzyme E1 A